MAMSFMGAVRALMGGSGVADLWKEVYAKNSVDAMTGGQRALRAHFLTQAALASLVLDKMVGTGQISDENIEKKIRRSFRQALQKECENNRTGGLWLQYFDQSSVVGLAFPDVHLRRKDKAVVNISATNAAITVGEDRLQVNPNSCVRRLRRGPSTMDVHVQHIRPASIAARLSVTLDKTAEVTRDEFLGSSENKAQFLPLLSARRGRAGVQVRHADGDYLIVQTALEAGTARGSVVMVGEDMDLLVLLAVHADNTDVSMLMPGRQDSPRRVFCSKKLQEALGPRRDQLLLLHAFTGSENTSATYKRGKHMGFAKLEQLHQMTEVVHEVTKYFPMSETIKADLERETALDPGLSVVIKYCREGWPNNKNKVDNEAKPHWQIRMDIFVGDNLVIPEDRIIVPVKLRKAVLKKIHTAHLGIDKTKDRARQSLYWPGMSNDIANLTKECRRCESHSANNFREPLISHEIPSLSSESDGGPSEGMFKDTFLEHLRYCYDSGENLYFYKTSVYAEMTKSVTYCVYIRLDSDKMIDRSHCDCVAGHGGSAHCKHVIVTFLDLEDITLNG
ncbi:hypothetical protein FOCC_FOCC013299 [Frankliniella occidentalis]|nr:hypothetical protein FOCC_FOCC013299 [Frankliniella occidentalis]